MAKNDTVYRSY